MTRNQYVYVCVMYRPSERVPRESKKKVNILTREQKNYYLIAKDKGLSSIDPQPPKN